MVNGDRLLDFGVQLYDSADQLQPGDTQGVLRGQTLTGVPIIGTGPITCAFHP